MFKLLTELSSNFGIMLIIIVLLSNQKIFKQMILKEEMLLREKAFLALLFGGLGILATLTGVNIKGAIANTRELSVIFGGLLGGPVVGIGAGVIAGAHRYFFDPSGITSLPCAITTVIGGMFSGYLYTRSEYKERWKYGILSGLFVVTLNMGLVLLYSKPFDLALDIVKTILVPMEAINTVGIAILLLITENIFKEKESMAAKQSVIALDIADKTLPYFLNPGNDSYSEICKIIGNSTGADGVLITGMEKVLAASRKFEEYEYETFSKIIKDIGEDINKKKVVQINGLNKTYDSIKYRTLVASPILEKGKIIGELIILYKKNEVMGYKEEVLFERLSGLLSTQFELVKIEKLKKEASRSEIKALQTQINPHFLFNSLNTVVSLVRIDPDKARDLIINLSDFLRYNIESSLKLIDIEEEIGHVKSYVNIEQARFGDRVKIEYELDDQVDIKIPVLIIQPLVENSIKHGMRVNTTAEENRKIKIKVSVKKDDFDSALVSVEDDGIGILPEVIDKLQSDNMSDKNIGLSNVHNRLKIIYGNGLEIERLDRGTRISFRISESKNEEFIKTGEKYELFNN
jgi:two-component system LytT family sensor kinase